MTVLMMARFAGDPKRLEKLAKEDRHGAKAIAEKAKSYGVIRHRFFGTENEIVVIDEWPTADDFERFYKDSPEIQDMFGRAGVTGEPSIMFARLLDIGDEVG